MCVLLPRPDLPCPPQNQVAQRLQDCVDDFREVLPLMEELANPALQERHWRQVFEVIGVDMPRNDEGTGETRAAAGGRRRLCLGPECLRGVTNVVAVTSGTPLAASVPHGELLI